MKELLKRWKLRNKPKWKDAPEWANWLGVNITETGTWHWYQSKPLPNPFGYFLWSYCEKLGTTIAFKTHDIVSTIGSRPKD